MRDVSLSFRVEPETARSLTWLTNKYNYENTAALTKTDVIESFIQAAAKDADVLELALYLAGKNDNFSSYEVYLESRKGEK